MGERYQFWSNRIFILQKDKPAVTTKGGFLPIFRPHQNENP